MIYKTTNSTSARRPVFAIIRASIGSGSFGQMKPGTLWRGVLIAPVACICVTACGSSPPQQVAPQTAKTSNYYIGKQDVYARLVSGSATTYEIVFVVRSKNPVTSGCCMNLPLAYVRRGVSPTRPTLVFHRFLNAISVRDFRDSVSRADRPNFVDKLSLRLFRHPEQSSQY